MSSLCGSSMTLRQYFQTPSDLEFFKLSIPLEPETFNLIIFDIVRPVRQSASQCGMIFYTTIVKRSSGTKT